MNTTLHSMETLQNKWYNSVLRASEQLPSAFQLLQPAVPIVKTNAGLWSRADVIPVDSLTWNAGFAGSGGFFANYAAVAGQFQFPDDMFMEHIGPVHYKAWKAYLETVVPAPSITALPEIFFRWATIFAPDVANIGLADLTAAALYYNAQQALLPYQGPDARPPDFHTTWDGLVAELAASSPRTWKFDSQTASPDVGSTWTGGLNFGFSGLYAGVSPYAPLSRYFGESRVTVTAKFTKFGVFVMVPGAWYNSSILSVAFSCQGSPPWPPGANPNWEDTFGPTATMPRFLASLAIADGVTMTVRSDARYGQAAQNELQTHMAKGLWPVFAPTSAVASNTLAFGASEGMTMEITTQGGSPVVVGANVLSTKDYLGHA